MRPLKVGIMGAGRIAQGFDHPGSEKILTLAHAVRESDRFVLGGFYDLHSDRAERAEEKWTCPASSRDREKWLDAGWDAVFIATPDDCHAQDLEAVLARKPQAVLIEKPLTSDGVAAERLLRQAHDLGVPVILDFPRRWHSGIRKITELLKAGELGAPRQMHGICSGGVLHNGIHLFDLIAGWCGEFDGVELVKRHGAITWLQINAKTGPVQLILAEAVQGGTYNWQLDVQFDRARLELAGAPEGLVLHRQGPHPNYPDFLTLVPAEEWPMEDEPLLPRMLEQLAALIDDPAAASAQIEMELARQSFFTSIMRFFEN